MDDKKKIIEALKRSANEWHKEEFDPMARTHFSYIEYTKLADVLIAANIGDVSWWERKCKLCEEDWFLQKKQIEHYAESYKEMLQEDLDKYKHRAEVAERAFDNTIKAFHETLSALFPDTKVDLDEWKKNNLANAEKQIEEERKV